MNNCNVTTTGTGVWLEILSNSYIEDCSIDSEYNTALWVEGWYEDTNTACTIKNSSFSTASEGNYYALKNEGGDVTIIDSQFTSEHSKAVYFYGMGRSKIESAQMTSKACEAFYGYTAGNRVDESLTIFGCVMKVPDKSMRFIWIDGSKYLDSFISRFSTITIGENVVERDKLPNIRSLTSTASDQTCTITDNRNNPAYQIKDVQVTCETDIWGKACTGTSLVSTATSDAKIKSVQWQEYYCGSSYGNKTSGNFKRSNDYKAVIRISSDTKFFPEDDTRTVTVNGEETDQWYVQDGDLYVEYWYDSPEKLQEISLTVKPPVTGEKLASDSELEAQITYSEEYYYHFYAWSSQPSSMGGSWNSEDTYAKAGKVYYLSVPMITNSGYHFDIEENLEVTVNPGNDAWQPISKEIERTDSFHITLVLGFVPLQKQGLHVIDGVAMNTRGEIVTEAAVGEMIILSPETKAGQKFAGWEGLDNVEFGSNFYSSPYNTPTFNKNWSPNLANPRLYMPAEGLNATATYTTESETYFNTVSIDNAQMYVGYSADKVLDSVETGSADYRVAEIQWYQVDREGNRSEAGTYFDEDTEYIATFYLAQEASAVKSFTEAGSLNRDTTEARIMTATVNGYPVMDCGGVNKGGKRYGYVTCYMGKPCYRIDALNGARAYDAEDNLITSAKPGDIISLEAKAVKDGKLFRYWWIEYARDDKEYYPAWEDELTLIEDCHLTDPGITLQVEDMHYRATPVYASDADTVTALTLTGHKTPHNGQKLYSGIVSADIALVSEVEECWYTTNKDIIWTDSIFDKLQYVDEEDIAEYGEHYVCAIYITMKDGKCLPIGMNTVSVSCGGREADAVYSYGTEMEAYFDYGTLCPEKGLYIAPIGDLTYTGSAVKPAIAAYCNGIRLQEGRDYSISYKNNVNAATKDDGKKAPTVTITGKKNYKGSYSRTFTIAPAVFGETSGIEVKDITVIANGKQIFAKPVVTYNGRKVSASEYTVTYVGKEDKNKFCDPGTYTIRITGNGRNFAKNAYKYVEAEEIVVSKLTTKNLDWKLQGTKTYTGDEIKLYGPAYYYYDYKLKDASGNKLAEGTDYTVTYKNNINKGKATITFTGIGKYTGSISKTFTIAAAPIAVTNADKSVTRLVKVTGFPETVSYEKGGAGPDNFVLLYNGRVLKRGRDYTLTYQNHTKVAGAGESKPPTVIVTGKGNYTGSFRLTYTISKTTLDESYVLTANDVLYKNAKNNYVTAVTVTDAEGRKLTAGTDYDKKFTYEYYDTASASWKAVSSDRITIPDSEEELRMRITVNGIGSYTGTVTGKYRLYRYKAGQFTVAAIPAQTYTGDAVELSTSELKVTDSKTKEMLTYGTDYTVRYEKNTNAGTATVIICGMGRYGGEIKKTFKINKAVLATQNKDGTQTLGSGMLVALTPADQTYTGSALKPGDFEVSYYGNTLTAGKDYTVSYKNNTKASEGITDPNKRPMVVLTGKGNFAGKLQINFTVKKAPMSTATVTVRDLLYKNAKNNYVTTVTVADAKGKKLTAGTDYEKNFTYEYYDGTWKKVEGVDRIDCTDKDELPMRVTVKGNGNYTGTLTKEYRIYTKDISKAAVAKIANQPFNGRPVCPEPSVTYDGGMTTLIKDTNYTLEYQKNKDIGTATIIIRGKGAYGGEKKVTFKITPPYELTWWEKLL